MALFKQTSPVHLIREAPRKLTLHHLNERIHVTQRALSERLMMNCQSCGDEEVVAQKAEGFA